MKNSNRVIVWFSCGSCSTVAAKQAIKKYGIENIVFVYCDVKGDGNTTGEHEDNKRFLNDVENYLGIKIIKLSNPNYESPFDVYEKTGFLVSSNGARCTVELKKKLSSQFEQPDDIQIFGYAFDEQDRQIKFNERYPECKTDFILNDFQLTKANCKGLIWKWGLELPVMYKQGYDHNNCIGCVKGGKGYWNKIRKDYPLTFEKMALLERKLNHSIIKEKIGEDKNGKAIYENIFLDKLNPDEGNFKEEIITCDFNCQSIYE